MEALGISVKNRSKSIIPKVMWFTLALIFIGNTVFFFLLKDTGEIFKVTGQLDLRIITVRHIDRSRQLIGTIDNKVAIVDKGMIEKSTSFDSTLQTINLSKEGKHIYIGFTDKKLYTLNENLKIQGQFTVKGRIMDVDVMDDGSLLIVYGTGDEYSDKYYVGHYTPEGKLLFEFNTGYTTRVLGYSGSLVFYGTDDSRVGAISVDGMSIWEKTLDSTITQLITIKSTGKVFVSDERGTVYLMTDTGEMIWHNKISEYKIRSVAWDKNLKVFLAGDQDGVVYILDTNGILIYKQKLSSQGVIGIFPDYNGSVSVVSNSGHFFDFDLNSALKENNLKVVRQFKSVYNIILTLLFLVFLVASVKVLRKKALWLGRQLYRSKQAYVLLIPTFIILMVFVYYPAFTAVLYSFTNFSFQAPIKFIGLENYVKMLYDDYFWTGLLNMLKILLTSFAKELTMPLIVAEFIFWIRNERHKYLFRTAFVIPSIVPGIVSVLMWKMIYDPNIGLINNTLEILDLKGLQHSWLGDEKLAMWSIIFAGFPWIHVFAFLVYFGGLINISRDIYDASKIDGIGMWSRFWKIDIPMILPQLKLILFFTYLGSIQTFTNVWVFTQGGPGHATYVPALHMYLKISKENLFGYASALGIVLFIFILIGSLLNMRLGRRAAEVTQ